MPIIQAGAGIVTQINTFDVPQGGADAMLTHLERGVAVACQVPGWRSASLHRSLNGRRIVNYAQSDSAEAA